VDVKNIEVIKLDNAEIDKISDLWRELNSLHYELSANFKSHFAAMDFEKRKESIQLNQKLAVFAAPQAGEYVGYCICSVNNLVGEIDSLFVKERSRSSGLGSALTRTALQWLNENNCEKINISVAEGNRQVLSFYEKFGFRHRFYVMQNS